MQVQPYLFFDGRCEEALEFYKSTLGIKVDYTLYSYDGDVDNGQFIYSPADRRLFRLTGAHGKSYARGTLRTFWSYSVEEITSQVIWDTGAQV